MESTPVESVDTEGLDAVALGKVVVDTSAVPIVIVVVPAG